MTVQVGVLDDDGTPITSCVVEPIEETPSVQSGKAARGPNQGGIVRNAFLDAYERLADAVEPSIGLDWKSSVRRSR